LAGRAAAAFFYEAPGRGSHMMIDVPASLRQMRIRLCSLYRCILVRRPTSEILDGLSPNCDSEVSQVGVTQSTEIRDHKTKTNARSVLVFILNPA
jgi:hypothetical protein